MKIQCTEYCTIGRMQTFHTGLLNLPIAIQMEAGKTASCKPDRLPGEAEAPYSGSFAGNAAWLVLCREAVSLCGWQMPFAVDWSLKPFAALGDAPYDRTCLYLLIFDPTLRLIKQNVEVPVHGLQILMPQVMKD